MNFNEFLRDFFAKINYFLYDFTSFFYGFFGR